MGGDITTLPGSDTGEEDSSFDKDSSQLSSSLLSRNGLSMNIEDPAVDGQNGLVFGEYHRVRSLSSSALDFEVNQKRRENVYQQVLLSNDERRVRSEGLEEAKRKVLRYTPGAWVESAGALKSKDYDVPKTTTLLLVGPKGSGKSSLVNKISKVFEDAKFASERAQVSYNSSEEDGTFFLQEYMIPRSSTSFCLYDTRGFSDDSHENFKVFEHWMEKGVRRGELVIRDSDSESLRTTMMCKSRDNRDLSSEIRQVNFVVFVVNGLSVLKSMESDEDAEKQYTKMITAAFNCPYLAFKDDKPLLVVTHGDLLSTAERAHVRVHLGGLLGIPPTTQIFDIPESSDAVTELTIVDMLCYSIEHAEKHLPHKKKVPLMSLLPSMTMLLVLILGIAINIWYMTHRVNVQHGPFPLSQPHIQQCASPQMDIQHSHCPSPQADIQHGPSTPSLEAYILHSPLPQAHIQDTPPPQGRVQNDPLPQEDIYHGPLHKAELHLKTKLDSIRTKLHNIYTKPQEIPRHGPSPKVPSSKSESNFRFDWSKIRHLWLEE